jgi:hypothetical protein
LPDHFQYENQRPPQGRPSFTIFNNVINSMAQGRLAFQRISGHASHRNNCYEQAYRRKRQSSFRLA